MTATPETPAPRRVRMKAWHWFFVIAFVSGGVYGMASSFGFTWEALPAPALLAISTVAVALAMTGTVLWMRDIDELARQAHYEAWFWGGSSALCLMIFALFAAPALPGLIDFPAIERALAPFAGEGGGFFAGVAASLLALSIGYGVWWLVFWLRKR